METVKIANISVKVDDGKRIEFYDLNDFLTIMAYLVAGKQITIG